ncbi:MAG: hypothetical protein ACTSQJ_02670 [Promethearchaeota archaeon]
MKKIIYSLNIGLIGSLNSGKEILFDYLEDNAIKSERLEDKLEFIFIYKEIPIKIRFYPAKNLNEALDKWNNINILDVLILTLNLHNLNSLEIYNSRILDKLCEKLSFKGLSVLVGIQKDYSKIYRISKVELVKKAKDLNVLYCFEIQKNDKEILQFFSIIFEDFLFKFKYFNPEIFKLAKVYGYELLKQHKSKY